MSLAILADVLKCPHHGPDAVFTGVCHDTRSLQSGDLYVAIKGERFDGHNFLAEAIAAGAAGALLARDMETPLPYVRVPNTRLALGNLGAFWRNQFQIPVIAITGSNGKTTVKEMIGAILGETGPGCVTRGNLNNDIGVPLTLTRMRASDRYAVIEMGMNHFGEIEYLSRLTRPTVALITNAGEAHLAGVGSLEGVARAKGEIFTGLRTAGTAVLNADDPFFPLWKTLVATRRYLTFGLDGKADVSAQYRLTDSGSLIHLKTTTHGDIDMRVPLLGRHNVMNTLAGAGAAIAAGAIARAGQNRTRKTPHGFRPARSEAGHQRRAHHRRHLQRQSRLGRGRLAGAPGIQGRARAGAGRHGRTRAVRRRHPFPCRRTRQPHRHSAPVRHRRAGPHHRGRLRQGRAPFRQPRGAGRGAAGLPARGHDGAGQGLAPDAHGADRRRHHQAITR